MLHQDLLSYKPSVHTARARAVKPRLATVQLCTLISKPISIDSALPMVWGHIRHKHCLQTFLFGYQTSTTNTPAQRNLISLQYKILLADQFLLLSFTKAFPESAASHLFTIFHRIQLCFLSVTFLALLAVEKTSMGSDRLNLQTDISRSDGNSSKV